MNDKTIFIHIGLEKTGTTSIQNFLFNNAEELQKKSIFYPKILGVNQTSLCIYSGQTKYVRSLTSENREIKIKRELSQTMKSIINNFEKSNCKNLVFSNEHLSSRLKDTNDIKNLKELFKPYDYPIKIVVYVRNQVDLIESLYFEGVKAGEKNKLSDWASSFKYFELDLIKMLGKWESVFGENSILVRLFNKSTLKNGDAVDDFLDLVSVQIDEKFIRSHNQNISFGYKSIEFMRMYNSYINESERKTYILRNLLSDYGNDKEKISLLPDKRTILLNKYNVSNHEFVKKYLPGISYDFFTEISRKANKGKFSEDTLWDIINHIITQKENFKDKQQLHQKDKQQLHQKDKQQLHQKDKQLKQKQSEINTLLNNRWYRFGKLSNKRKIWTIGKVVSKKVKLYWLLQPLAKLIKKVLGK